MSSRKRGLEPWSLADTERQGDEDTPTRGAMQKQRKDVGGDRIGPLDVVEEQDDRALGRELLEQRSDRPRHTVALPRGRRFLGTGQLPDRRDHIQQLSLVPRLELPDGFGHARAVDRPKRVDQQGKGQIALKFGGSACKHTRAAALCVGGERPQ